MSQSGLTPPLHTWTATDIVQAIRHGHTTCAAVARACLDHIAVREPAVQAWQYLNAEQVMAQARALDQHEPSGPLHGVPFGIKDIIDTYDMPTEYGSPIYRGHQPASDAACVALSRKAGGLLMGKTVTTEFANVFPGKTRHPRDPHPWGLVEWLRSRGECLYGATGRGDADDRIDHSARVLLWHCGVSAHLWASAVHGRQRGGGIVGYPWVDGAEYRRHRPVS